MPIARFQLPDGRIGRFEVPEGTSPEQAMQLISSSLPDLLPKETPQQVEAPAAAPTAVPTAAPTATQAPAQAPSKPWWAPFAEAATGEAELGKQVGPKVLGGNLAQDIFAAGQATPTYAKAATQALVGGNSPEDLTSQTDWRHDTIAEARELSKKNAKDPSLQDEYILGITRQKVRELPQNAMFSVISMGAGLAAGAAGMVAGPVGAYGAGTAASGLAAYRMDTNGFLRDIRENLDEASVKATGKPLTDKQWLDYAKQYNGLVQEHGLWEAVPEALGNALGAKLGATIFREAGKGLMGTLKSFGATALEFGTELGTETVTQTGQHNVEVDAGLSDQPKRSFANPNDIAKSAKEVLPDVLLLSGMVAGGAHVAGKVYNNTEFGQNKQIADAIKENVKAGNFSPDKIRKEAIARLDPNSYNQEAIKPEETVDLNKRLPAAVAPPEQPPEEGQQVAPPTEQVAGPSISQDTQAMLDELSGKNIEEAPVEKPKAEEPKVEEPKALEPPKKEEPKVEEQVKEEPAAPKVEEALNLPPKTEELKAEEKPTTVVEPDIKVGKSKLTPAPILEKLAQPAIDGINKAKELASQLTETMSGNPDAQKAVDNLNSTSSILNEKGQAAVDEMARNNKKTPGEQNRAIQKASAELKKALIEHNKSLNAAKKLITPTKARVKKTPAPLELVNKTQEQLDLEKLNKDLESAEMARRQIKTTGLFGALRGKLKAKDINDISPDKEYAQLKNKNGGASLVDIVASGDLDAYLPYKLRHDHPDFDNKDAADYIAERLSQKNYMTIEAEDEIKKITGAIDELRGNIKELEDQIKQQLELKDVNLLLEEAFNEQREADLADTVIEPEGENRAVEPGKTKLALTGQTPDEVRAAERAKEDRLKAEREAEAKAKADEGVGEFTLTGSNRPADIAAAKGQEGLFDERTPEVKEHPEWATGHAKDVAGKIVYSDDDAALLQGHSLLSGKNVYSAIDRESGKRTTSDIRNFTGKLFKPDVLQRLQEQANRIETEDKANQAKFPDGPFQNKGNVVGTDDFDPKYVSYLEGLLNAANLGGLKVFLIHPDDARANAEKYNLYGDYSSAKSAGMSFTEDGSTRLFGPNNKYAYISVKPGLSETRTIETIAHEVGHIIEKVALNSAPKEIKDQLVAEHKKWVEKNVKGAARDLILNLRNRETGEAHAQSVIDNMPAKDLTRYWTSFDEWFADNVSRWATTADKPISVVEKFFANVAKKLKELVGIITGNKFSPNEEVAKFIENMGPSTVQDWYTSKDKASSESYFSTSDAAFEPIFQEEKKRNPSFKRAVTGLNKSRNKGILTDEEFALRVGAELDADNNRKSNALTPARRRGILHIKARLNEEGARNVISKEAIDLAEWFMNQNPSLVDDLGISIKKGERGTGGNYESLRRIFSLMKNAGSDETPIHEILHHTERMMPGDIQNAIRKEWLQQLLKAQKNAKTQEEKVFFAAVMDSHFGDNRALDIEVKDKNGNVDKSVNKFLYDTIMRAKNPGESLTSSKLAKFLLQHTSLPIANYRFVNPSEFWAVNGSRIVAGDYAAIKGTKLDRLKNWLGKLAEKIKSLFGFRSDAPILKALNSLSKSDGVFQSSEMLGGTQFESINQGQMFPPAPKPQQVAPLSPQGRQGNMFPPGPPSKRNVFGGPAPQKTWDLAPETKLGNLINTLDYKIHDKHVDTRQVQAAITKNVGLIDDAFDAYMKEELYHGRTANEIKDFLKNDLSPVVKDLISAKLSIDDLEQYLHNRHAEERNDAIAQINPRFADVDNEPGSGIGTQAARDYFKNLDPTKAAELAKIAAKVDDIIKGTQKILVDRGLETQATIDNWNQAYKHYIPLMRDQEELDFMHHGVGLGKGFQVKGGASKRAYGSTKSVVDILANIAIQRESAIIRSEKARIGRALYGMALKNPNPDFWLPVNPDAIKNKAALYQELVSMGLPISTAQNFIQEPKTPSIDPLTGQVRYTINAGLRSSPNVFPVRINGKDRYIFFNTKDPKAIRMAQAMSNLDAQTLGGLLGTSAQITRWIASVNTQFNPVFGVINFTRDSFGAAFNLTNTPLAGKQKEVAKHVFPAMFAIFQGERASRKNAAITGPYVALYDQFRRAGGTTGFRESFAKGNFSGKDTTIVERLWADETQSGAMKKARYVFDALSDYNEAMENAVRLSVFKVALDMNLSEERAASLAKNITINFNRKGQSSPLLQALYAFFNPAVQGAVLVGKTLNGPAGRKIIAGGLAVGVLQALWMAAAGFDADEPPDYIRDKNFIIPIGNKKYLTLPMPPGYNVVPGVARIATEYILGKNHLISGGKPITDAATQVLGLFLDSFNPLGGGTIAQMLSPTPIDPIVSVTMNKDAFGRPIFKEDLATKPTPGFMRSRENSTQISQWIAEFLNYVSSPPGTHFTKGKISPTADEIDYYAGQIGGGAAREVIKAGELVKSAFTSEPVPSYRIPLAGRFYGDAKSQAAIQDKFYNNITLMNKYGNEIMNIQKSSQDPSKFIAANPAAQLYNSASEYNNMINEMNKNKKMMLKNKVPLKDIRDFEAQKYQLMKSFNDQVADAQKRR